MHFGRVSHKQFVRFGMITHGLQNVKVINVYFGRFLGT